jgi:hypothetical protein
MTPGKEVTTRKNFFTTRRNYLLTNAEVSQAGPVIAEVNLYNVADGQWTKPVAGETPHVTTAVTSASGIFGVKRYCSAELTGNFTAVVMLDDGQHHDGAANDGLYGASLPAQTAGTSVRFYVEAAANLK